MAQMNDYRLLSPMSGEGGYKNRLIVRQPRSVQLALFRHKFICH